VLQNVNCFTQLPLYKVGYYSLKLEKSFTILGGKYCELYCKTCEKNVENDHWSCIFRLIGCIWNLELND